jgi:hypothetical protein
MTTEHHPAPNADMRHMWGLNIPEAELTARLAESRCVWCGTGLHGSADDMFCRETHETAWRAAKYADFQSGDVSIDRQGLWGDIDRSQPPPSWLGEPFNTSRRGEPIDVTQAELNAIPQPPMTEVPALQLDHVPGHDHPAEPRMTAASPEDVALIARLFGVPPEMVMSDVFDVPAAYRRPPPAVAYATSAIGGLAIYPGPELPTDLDYVLPYRDRDNDDDLPEPVYGVTAVAHREPGMVATQATSRPHPQGFALGRSYIPGYRQALEEIGPEPEPRTGWPLNDLAAWERQGWKLAMPNSSSRDARHRYQMSPPALLPERTCPRCGSRRVPLPVTGRFPYVVFDYTPWSPSRPATPVGDFGPRRMTKLCCGRGRCRLPFPGPTLVPLHRAHPSGWGIQEYAVVSTRGHMVRQVTEEAIDQATPGVLQAMVWEDLWEGVLQGGTVWGCCHPGCEGKSAHWVRLTTRMSWDGHLWEPSDGEPLRLPLCPAHWYSLRRELFTSPEVSERLMSTMVVYDGAEPHVAIT